MCHIKAPSCWCNTWIESDLLDDHLCPVSYSQTCFLSTDGKFCDTSDPSVRELFQESDRIFLEDVKIIKRGLTIFTYFGWSVYETQPIWGLGLFEFHLHLGGDYYIDRRKAKISVWPPPLVIKKMKIIYMPWNNFCMIWVAYTCQMASLERFKGLPTIRTRIQAEEGPPTQKVKKNKCV